MVGDGGHHIVVFAAQQGRGGAYGAPGATGPFGAAVGGGLTEYGFDALQDGLGQQAEFGGEFGEVLLARAVVVTSVLVAHIGHT